MKDKNPNEALDFVFDFSKMLEKDQISYVYRGIFSQSIIVDILSLTEKNIVKAKDPSKVKKKVYNLMVECLQNITKHQATFKNSKIQPNGLFTIQYKVDKYYITTGNLIRKENILKLKQKIDQVNTMSKEDLKKHYRDQLKDGKISERGGAGLGFIDMARKSGNKLFFDFKEIDPKHSYFYFRIQISTDPVEPVIKDVLKGASLDHISEVHKLLTQRNILLVYNNIFNEEKQTNLLSYLQSHLAKSVLTRIEVYNVMVEMMTNISKHGAVDEITGEGKEAIFFISEEEKEYQLFSGNYINDKNVKSFKKKLETINYLDRTELDTLLKERSKKQKDKTETGMIDMRLNSISDWSYKFYKTGKKYTYFTLQIKVLKN